MKAISPQLIADVTLYASERGGRKEPTPADWFGCPCMVSKDRDAWDCRILLQGIPLAPGETRRVGMVFLSHNEAIADLRQAAKFYLWEGRFIGEGTIVEVRTAAEGVGVNRNRANH
jgi:hypothetical protein